MTSIGETLRRERLRQGLNMQALSESTKIGTRMLQAMEADDFTKLPGGVFTRSFVRQYAVALGINPASIENELKSLHSEFADPTHVETNRFDAMPNQSYRYSGNGMAANSLLASLLWVVIAVLVCGGVYYVLNRPPAPVAAPTASPVATTPPTVSETKPNAVAPAPAASPAEAPLATSSGDPLQVSVTAVEASWVSITADGKSQFEGTLAIGEKREVHAVGRLKVVAGNAGGLDFLFNGKPVEPIGPKGQVRTVVFTSEGAHVVPRMPPPSPLP